MSNPIKYPSDWFDKLQAVGKDIQRNVDFLAAASRPVSGFAVPEFRDSWIELGVAAEKLCTLLELERDELDKNPNVE